MTTLRWKWASSAQKDLNQLARDLRYRFPWSGRTGTDLFSVQALQTFNTGRTVVADSIYEPADQFGSQKGFTSRSK